MAASVQQPPSQQQEALAGSLDSSKEEIDSKNAETFNAPVTEPGTLAEFAAVTREHLLTPMPSAIDMLEVSMKNLPDLLDSERPKQYTPRTPVATPAYYPQTPAPLFDSPAIFEKFDTDTLFFIFYYQQGTYQQLRALSVCSLIILPDIWLQRN